MYNWSVNEQELKKYPEQYAIWRLEQMVNFGLGEEKIHEKDLKKYWNKMNIDPSRKKFLSILLYE